MSVKPVFKFHLRLVSRERLRFLFKVIIYVTFVSLIAIQNFHLTLNLSLNISLETSFK